MAFLLIPYSIRHTLWPRPKPVQATLPEIYAVRENDKDIWLRDKNITKIRSSAINDFGLELLEREVS